MKKIKFLALFIITLTISCSPNQDKEQQKMEEELYAEVMAVHDEVMPKMSRILSLERELKEAVEGLDSASSESLEKLEYLERHIARLQEADEAMMQWMRSFEVNQEGWAHDSIMSYLEKEKKRISQVQDKMLVAIEEAEGLLGIN